MLGVNILDFYSSLVVYTQRGQNRMYSTKLLYFWGAHPKTRKIIYNVDSLAKQTCPQKALEVAKKAPF